MRNRFPNLFIAGAGKSGTSSLHAYLNQHPDIFMSDVKEPRYFSNDEFFYKQTEQYLSLFAKGNSAKYIGESSTGYIAFPNVIERISSVCISPKFIFVLRNPVDRAYSHYNWLVGLGGEDKKFADAFIDDFGKEPLASENNLGLGYKYYYQWGRYAHWIERFIEKFGRENVFVITTESMARDPLTTVNSCFEFLGVKPLTEIDTAKMNETSNLKYKKTLRAFVALDSYLKNGLFRTNLKAIIPAFAKRLYNSLYVGLRKLLISKKSETPIQPMTASEREWVANFYREDVSNLKKILGSEFLEWADFAGNPASPIPNN